MNTKWKVRFLKLAKEISEWSKDPSTKVGAIAVDPESRRILSTGYNGFPSGVEDTEERLQNRELKYALTIHAELNCILNAVKNGVSLNGSYIFVWGLPVCSECAKSLIQIGVKQVYWSVQDKSKIANKWATSTQLSETLFSESNVGMTVSFVELN